MRRILIVLLVVGFVGCATVLIAESKVALEFRPGETSPTEGFTRMKAVAGSEETIYISKDAILTNEDVESTHVFSDPSDPYWPKIEILFTPRGAQKFARATKQNLKKPIGILVDGKLICAPIVREEITDGIVWISGVFTEEEAERIADGIMEGKRGRKESLTKDRAE